ncbi:hypothetical protein ACFX14_026035 [Malus domestica]
MGSSEMPHLDLPRLKVCSFRAPKHFIHPNNLPANRSFDENPCRKIKLLTQLTKRNRKQSTKFSKFAEIEIVLGLFVAKEQTGVKERELAIRRKFQKLWRLEGSEDGMQSVGRVGGKTEDKGIDTSITFMPFSNSTVLNEAEVLTVISFLRTLILRP